MKVRDVLSLPFVVRSQSCVTNDGRWVRRVSLPELGCSVEGLDVHQMLEELETEKVVHLVRLIETERTLPQCPRDPIHSVGLEERLRTAGLGAWVSRLDWDTTDVVEVARRDGSER